MNPQRIFISGPYSNTDKNIRDRNIRKAKEMTMILLKAGHYPFTPHQMTAKFDEDYPEIPYDRYMDWCLSFLSVCDGILLMRGWNDSKGATIEAATAKKLGIKAYLKLASIPTVDGFPSAHSIYIELHDI